MIQLPIVGVDLDYTDQQGAVFMDRSVFVSIGTTIRSTTFAYSRAGRRIADVRQESWISMLATPHVFVLTNERAASTSCGPTDQWFG